MDGKKMKVLSMLAGEGITVEAWDKIEDSIRNVLVEAIEDGFTCARIGYGNKISSRILKLLTELRPAYAEDIYIEAVIPSLADMPNWRQEHDILVGDCNGINVDPIRSNEKIITFTRNMIFDAERVVVITDGDTGVRKHSKDYIWYVLDYAKCLEKDVRIIEATGHTIEG